MMNEEEKSEIIPDFDDDVSTNQVNTNSDRPYAITSTNGDENHRKPPANDQHHEGWGFSDPKLRPFVIISITYLLFTITDGAIRMIVLLHAYNKAFSALQVAVMFTLYELAGVFTNLAAGMMGARWGIRFTLIIGLSLQILSYGLLFGWQDDWSKQQAIVYVTIAQMFAGIAKDLTKLGGKTVTKLVTPEGRDTSLFRIVSLLTGWKNSLKGVGYFLGSALLEVSYQAALWTMIAIILVALPFAIFGLSKDLGTAKKKNSSLKEIFVLDNFNLNVLSFARMFLFASRDFWFEVPVSTTCVCSWTLLVPSLSPFAAISFRLVATSSCPSIFAVQTALPSDPNSHALPRTRNPAQAVLNATPHLTSAQILMQEEDAEGPVFNAPLWEPFLVDTLFFMVKSRVGLLNL